MKKIIMMAMLALILAMPLVAAQFQEPDPGDTEAFNEILEPIFKIYNFIKYAATIIAVLIMLFAGITAIISGDNPAKRDQAKMMIMYVVIGLVIIWAAPLVVNLIVG